MPEHPIYSVLFLCTGNSARSIMAEAVLNERGRSRFRAYSAGSHPTGKVHPMTLSVLADAGFITTGLYSKSWDEFTVEDAPCIDFVITVCDSAAAEPCPLWPGHPTTAHWGMADPAARQGTEADCLQAFRQTLSVVDGRVRKLLDLPIDRFAKHELSKALRQVAKEREA